MKSITIPDGVTTIELNTFNGCSSLTSVTIPSSVTSIGGRAFEKCTNLATIPIPDNVTSIESDAFSETAWYNNQPNGLLYAGKVAYRYKGNMPENTQIAIPDGTLGIAGSAFSECHNLTSVTIPNTVTNIGNTAGAWCRHRDRP